jgi:hypothetical protein
VKSHLSHAIAALLASGAVSLAAVAAAPASTTALPFAPGPIASSYRDAGPDAPLAKSIADALNADQSLQGSKITVQFDENGNVLLTGASLSLEQAGRAAQIAATQAGGVVVNVIQPDHLPKYGVQPATTG